MLRGVITNYAYDQLNRPVQKSYTNDSSHTVAVKYGHDGVAGTYSCPPAFTSANPVGKRTAMCDAAGVESWSYPITANVGWKTIDQRKTNNVTETITTQDNLDGSVATLTYPSGRVVTYTPGRAGRPLAAADSSNSYVTNATYAPFGALTGMNNGSSITVNNSYNTRMQPQSLGATGASGSILSLAYDFHSGNGDNGNVYTIINGNNANRTTNYTYDPLNRIAAAWLSGPTWGETYTYDAWGNLTNRGPVAGKTYTEPLNAAPAFSNNQLPSFSYVR